MSNIKQFMDITGADERTAKMYLETSGTFEQAISFFFETQSDQPAAPKPAKPLAKPSSLQQKSASPALAAKSSSSLIKKPITSSPSSRTSLQPSQTAKKPASYAQATSSASFLSGLEDEYIPPPKAPVVEKLVGDSPLAGMARRNFSNTSSSSSSAGVPFTSLGAGFNPHLSKAFDLQKLAERTQIMTTIKKDAQLEKLYEPPFEILFKSDFDAAKRTAKEEKKLLIVNIQVKGFNGSAMLNKEFWKDPEIKSLVQSYCILYQIVNPHEEALTIVQNYNIDLTKLPCIMFIDPRTGQKLKFFDKEQLKTKEDLKNKFLTCLQDCLDDITEQQYFTDDKNVYPSTHHSSDFKNTKEDPIEIISDDDDDNPFLEEDQSYRIPAGGGKQTKYLKEETTTTTTKSKPAAAAAPEYDVSQFAPDLTEDEMLDIALQQSLDEITQKPAEIQKKDQFSSKFDEDFKLHSEKIQQKPAEIQKKDQFSSKFEEDFKFHADDLSEEDEIMREMEDPSEIALQEEILKSFQTKKPASPVPKLKEKEKLKVEEEEDEEMDQNEEEDEEKLIEDAKKMSAINKTHENEPQNPQFVGRSIFQALQDRARQAAIQKKTEKAPEPKKIVETQPKLTTTTTNFNKEIPKSTEIPKEQKKTSQMMPILLKDRFEKDVDQLKKQINPSEGFATIRIRLLDGKMETLKISLNASLHALYVFVKEKMISALAASNPEENVKAFQVADENSFFNFQICNFSNDVIPNDKEKTLKDNDLNRQSLNVKNI